MSCAKVCPNLQSLRKKGLSLHIFGVFFWPSICDLKLFEALQEINILKDRLENENEYLQEEIKSKINADNIICTSENYAKVLAQVQQVAATDTTVLITGESGTGKELLANAVTLIM